MGYVTPKVKLIGYTKFINEKDPLDDKPDKIVAAAAKLCYSQVGIEEIAGNITDNETELFLTMLNGIGHKSPFEHANYVFAIEGISRTCSHQLVRHRIASYSQQSQRYVDLGTKFQYIIPDPIRNNPEAQQVYIESIEKDFESYKAITELLAIEYMNSGMNEKSANKKALEDARFALPNACETKMVMSINARSLFNFFHQRCCNRAQWEIREVANQMLDSVLEISPYIFSNAGAPCTFDKCPEGKMSCGIKQEPRPLQLTKKLGKN